MPPPMATTLRRTPTPALAPAGLPGDVRLMNAAASALFVLAAAGALAAAWLWVMRTPLVPVRGIQLEGDLTRNSVPTIRANATPRLAGNFFSVDLQAARDAFEAVPWVRNAVVRRVWPDRLAVRLEEHKPAALWAGDDTADRLVNTHGEVFVANVGDVEDDNLPILAGPEGQAAAMLALHRRLVPVLEPLGLAVQRLQLSGRGSWRVELDNGATLELGRGGDDEVIARTERFVRTLPQVVQRFNAPLEYADLRHPGGYAVRLRGVGTTPAAAGPAAKKN